MLPFHYCHKKGSYQGLSSNCYLDDAEKNRRGPEERCPQSNRWTEHM